MLLAVNLKIYSKALYSSWGYYAPTRTLFDCGEGCATALGNYVYAPEQIIIGHGHGDHVLGLPSFIGCRNSGRGDKNKPLTVYAPPSHAMTDLKEFIVKRNPSLNYELKFVDIVPGSKIVIADKTYIEPFDVKHCYNSLGFKVMEKRSRLKAGINPADIRDLKAKGIDIHEEYEAPVFVWTLDSASYDLKHIQGAAHLVADGTFLKSSDRDDPTHASVEEVIAWATAAKVKRLSIAHISTRYEWKEARNFIAEAANRLGWNGQILDIILSDHVYEL